MGRIERYLDKAGVTRKAVAYGKEAGAMKIWFSYDDVLKALGTWVTPEVPYWYNKKKWNNKMRKEHEKKDKSEKNDNDQYKKKEDPRKGHKHQYSSYDPRREEPELNHYPEDYYHRERHSYSHDPRFHSDSEKDYDIPLSGVGRTSGPSYPPRRERNTNPGYDQRGRSPVGIPIDMVQIPCCDDSLMSGFWPHPSRKEFYIKKRPHGRPRRISMDKNFMISRKKCSFIQETMRFH